MGLTLYNLEKNHATETFYFITLYSRYIWDYFKKFLNDASTEQNALEIFFLLLDSTQNSQQANQLRKF